MSAPRPPAPEPGTSSSDRMADLVERWELREAIGGARGILDSALASTVFLLAYVLGGKRLAPALAAALGVTVVLLVVRLVRREPVRQALSGVVLVAVSAAIAAATGRAANFFVVGIAIQLGYAVGYLVSLALGWPLLGVLVGPLLGEGFRWRSDPPRRRAYVLASWIWFGVFATRVAIQLPLYLHDRVVSLGVSTLLLGWPMFALAALLSWLVLRRVPLSLGPTATDPSGDTGTGPQPSGQVSGRTGPGQDLERSEGPAPGDGTGR